MKRAIVIFARSPRAEAAAKGAGNLERLFRAVGESWLRIARHCNATPVIACPRDDRAALESIAPEVPRLIIEQRGESFGTRLEAAARDAFAAGFETLLVTGIDTPPLPSLGDAFAAVERGAVAIAPSTDGGINAIVLRRADTSILSSFAQRDSHLLRRCLEHFAQRALLLVACTDIDSVRDATRALREFVWHAYRSLLAPHRCGAAVPAAFVSLPLQGHITRAPPRAVRV